MEIKKDATAGTLESSDIYVRIEPNQNGIELELQSVVYNQFSEEIEKTAREVLKDFDVKNVKVILNDRGAVECAIRARIETALMRAGGVDN